MLKKRFILIFIMAIAMLSLFNLKSFYANAGIFTKSLYTCWPMAWTELECYNDSTGLSGYTGILSSAECCAFCNSRKSTCAITKSGKTDHFTEYDFNANGADSFSTAQDVLECASASNNFVGACPNTASYNGNPCTVRKVNSADENKIFYNDSDSVWDASNKQCIACGWWIGLDTLTRYNSQISTCGDTSGIYFDSSGNCNKTIAPGALNFRRICGADSACEGINYNNACTNGAQCESRSNTCNSAKDKCSLTGKCVCENSCTIGQFSCSGPQLQKCVDNGSGCGIWQNDTTAANEIGKCGDSIDNDCDGSVDAADPDCVAACSIVFTNTKNGSYATKSSSYNKMGIALKVESSKSSEANVKNPGGTEKYSWLPDKGSCATGSTFKYPAYTLTASDTVGPWTANIYEGVCSSTCTASATVNVVTCFDDADCGAGGKCNASGACSAAPTPTPTPPPGNVSVTNCVNCDPAASGGNCTDMTGNALWTSAAAPTNTAECLADTKIQAMCAAEGAFVNTCNIVLSNGTTCPCTVAGPVCNNDGSQNNGETGVDCGGGGCPVCGPAPSVCSGISFYRSPLNYCTIQELLEASTGWILGLVSSIIILILIIGGIMYVASTGDQERIRTAKNIIYYAVLGLAIILLSYSMIAEIKIILKIP